MEKHNMFTAGIDIGDRQSQICIIGEENGEVVVFEKTVIRTTPADVMRYFSPRSPMVVALEVGTHSPWMSEIIEELGHEVLIANTRKTSFIYNSDDKTDATDAEKLARVARADAKLLYPIKHREKEIQSTMAFIRSRDILIGARSKLINHIRGVVKSSGDRMPSCSAERFHRHQDKLPEELKEALSPVMASIEDLTDKIRAFDRAIERICQDKFPETEILRQVPGIGPVTALGFVLLIGNPHLFSNNRKVGKYLGLVPKLDESGDSSPQLKITKAGNKYVRTLLINCAHYVLGRYGPESDLRSYGLRIAARGGKNAKKRATTAVARKLSVLLMALWKTGEEYQPFHKNVRRNKREKAA